MRYLRRAIREAQRVLDREHVQDLPVDVKSIASKWAVIIEEPLDRDISGMLVPLPEQTRKPWAIVVNSRHPKVRQRFTIAHELGHLLLHAYTSPHADRSYRLRDQKSSQGSVREEIEANRFAAELLMPERLLRDYLSEHVVEYTPLESDDRELSKLADDFDVSKQALSIRLSALLA